MNTSSDEFSTSDNIPLTELQKTWNKEIPRPTTILKTSSTDSSEDNITLALLRNRKTTGGGGGDKKAACLEIIGKFHNKYNQRLLKTKDFY